MPLGLGPFFHISVVLFEHDVSVPAPPSPRKEVVVDVNNNTDETQTTSNVEQVGN